MIIYIFLSFYISSDFCFMYLYLFVVRCLMVYHVYLLCEWYLLPLKIFIFVSFKNKYINLILKKRLLCLLQVFYVFMLCGNVLSGSFGTGTGEGVWWKSQRRCCCSEWSFQRPCFLLCSTGKGHRACCSPNSPSVDSMSLVKSLNFSRFSPVQNEQSYAHVFETGV